MKFFTLYSAKYKKKGFKSTAREDATFHSTFISHTQIGGKLENNLSKLLKKRTIHVLHQTTVYVGPLKKTTTHLSAEKMEALRKGHVTFRMLSIKKRLLSRLFCTKY